MKKIFSIMCAMALIVCAGQAFASQYTIDGANPLALQLDTGSCQTVSIALDSNGITTALITAGFWLEFDPAQVLVNSVAVADGTVPGPWDNGFTSVVPDPAGPGTYFVAVGQFATVPADGAQIPLGDVELCCQAAGVSQIIVQTIPNFDTVVGDTTVWDPLDNNGIIDLTQVAPSCRCLIDGPPVVSANANLTVEADYDVDAVNPADCVNPPAYVFSTDCTAGEASIDPNTGILTVGPYIGDDDICSITVVDTANTDINTGETVTCTLPITIESGSACAVEIALGRECPGEAIDDPAFGRPGRRGLAATCGDVIDFTICDDCPGCPDPADPELVMSISPELPWLDFRQVDDCCWRLTIGDTCQDLEQTQEVVITAESPCNFTDDSIIVEIGKVVIDLGDTAVDPQSGTAEVEVNLINNDHHVRALDFTVLSNNLECTACTADPNRALQFTCSAAPGDEDGDGEPDFCRVVMYSTNPAALIAQGTGQVATILYDAVDPAAGNCEVVTPVNELVSDQFNEALCTCGAPGEVCFKTCGDIYPPDCPSGGACANEVCGDGVVDLFDILEAIDIILGLQIATDCQIDNADVPNGMPPYCGNPPGEPNCQTDGDVDIFDVLVMIDKALGKANCCDYCTFGNIF